MSGLGVGLAVVLLVATAGADRAELERREAHALAQVRAPAGTEELFEPAYTYASNNGMATWVD